MLQQGVRDIEALRIVGGPMEAKALMGLCK